mmetsp:Transcript_52323/g.124897  ORF Transcript_52323/g.124897 Transcript_52323/m.124897 type:complete len:425 (-) Transcript_52323:30-1304(-)
MAPCERRIRMASSSNVLLLVSTLAVLTHRSVAVDLSKGFPYPPDTRPQGCPKYKRSDFGNASVSIIIPWLGEKWEHMEGTMKALVHMTPDSLVQEYIWVSDGNADTREKELKEISPKVKVYGFPQRVGLMVAKTKGVEMATGNVIVFYEAHCIANKHWLQHILYRVVQNPKTLAMPYLDMIAAQDWHSYRPMSPGHWRYEWNFNLIYTNPEGKRSQGPEPHMSPGTSGGIFAIDKAWFDKLRLFDPGMREWGGDHMELTMKVWRCGGRIEMVPCSRVGHLYRDPSQRPYHVEVNTVVYNYKRLAELWAKDHLSYFYKMKPEAVNMKLEGMEPQIKRYEDLQQELQCKDLQWYLDNIDLEMKWEMPRICHPFAPPNDPIKCKGGQAALVPGRWTVTEQMPRGEYLQARKEADERLAADVRQRLEL